MKILHLDLQWLAGLLEGEGCFQYNGKPTPSIVVQMTDKDVINKEQYHKNRSNTIAHPSS